MRDISTPFQASYPTIHKETKRAIVTLYHWQIFVLQKSSFSLFLSIQIQIKRVDSSNETHFLPQKRYKQWPISYEKSHVKALFSLLFTANHKDLQFWPLGSCGQKIISKTYQHSIRVVIERSQSIMNGSNPVFHVAIYMLVRKLQTFAEF